MARTAKKIPFEEALEELEIVVQTLEDGDVTLDELLDKYTRGIALVKNCATQLEQTEKAIDKLISEKYGKIIEKQLQLEEDL